ncbi:MAG: hypothetical protein ABII64_03020 [Elusimicrobiota bacterium]
MNSNLNKPKQIKRVHEKAVCDQLLRTLALSAKFDRMGNDQGEPDVIYDLNNEHLGIEVCTAYYNDEIAKQEWTLARGERQFPIEGIEELGGGLLINPDDLIFSRVQSEIKDKCKSDYHGIDFARVWLVVELRAALSDMKSVEKLAKTLEMPKKHKFDAIYLCYQSSIQDGSDYKVVQLYPQ